MDKNFPSCGPSTSAEISENITIHANHCIETGSYKYCRFYGFLSTFQVDTSTMGVKGNVTIVASHSNYS